jgi:hypothetical protein
MKEEGAKTLFFHSDFCALFIEGFLSSVSHIDFRTAGQVQTFWQCFYYISSYLRGHGIDCALVIEKQRPKFDTSLTMSDYH